MSVFSIRLDEDITYTSHAGVVMTHSGGGTFSAAVPPNTVDTNSPTGIITYSGSWDIPLLAGRTVTWTYTASAGNYMDADGNALADKTLICTNCNSNDVVNGDFRHPVTTGWAAVSNGTTDLTGEELTLTATGNNANVHQIINIPNNTGITVSIDKMEISSGAGAASLVVYSDPATSVLLNVTAPGSYDITVPNLETGIDLYLIVGTSGDVGVFDGVKVVVT